MDGAPGAAVVCQHLGIDIDGRQILDQIDLLVPAGTVVGILGANGAGKSTLLSVLSGLRRHQRGRIMVLGRPPRAWDARHRRRLGIIPQETGLYDELTAKEHLDFTAALYGVDQAGARIGQLLARLGLEEHARSRASRLSGGFRRRIAIARALVHDPDLLLIDEPTLGVDAESRALIWSHLRSLRARGTAAMVASNYLDEIRSLCDTVVVLGGGRVLAAATIDELLERAGCSLEIDCDAAARVALHAGLAAAPEVSGIASAAHGLSLSCHGRCVPASLLQRTLTLAPGAVLRMREPDLADVFRAVSRPSA